jgi:multidrug efflux system membrane fusion protein
VAAACAVVAIAWFVRQRSGPAPRGATPAQGQAQARPVPVVATTVSRRDVPVYLEGLGNVIAYKTVMVKTQVDGVLEQVLFREGQAVRRGDVLAQVDPRPFQIQLKQGEGALARDRAQLVGARRNLERYEALAAEKLIPQQQADDQAALVGQLEGAVRVDEAAIASARLNLDYARIRSPIDGVTGIRNVDPGNVVHPGDQNGIVVVTQLDPIAVLFTLPQDQLTPVFTELARAPLPVEAFSRDGTTLLGKGQLALVDNQINQATSTVRLKAVVPNPKRVLWPNQFVNARLRLATRHDALVLPASAVQRGPSGTFVYVVGQDLTVTPRPLEVEATVADLVVVGKGVAEGERVVVEGQSQLRAGAKVAPREAGKPGGQAAAGGDGGARPVGAAAR